MAGKEWQELKNRLEFSERRRAFLQARLSKGSIEEDTTLWSFVDLMTLLLILFILFYSHSLERKASEDSRPDARPPAVAAPAPQTENTPADIEPVASKPPEPRPDASPTEAQHRQESLVQLQQQVLQSVSQQDKDDFSISWNQKRLVLVLGERIAFNVGEADLLPDFQPALKRIAGFISSQEGYKVEIAGHTDDVPIKTDRFPSNWELSAIRAVNVAKFIIANGVDPRRVSIQGYSAYRPLHDNTTPDNRQANRRVEIALIKEPEEQEATADSEEDDAPAAESMRHTRAADLPAYLKRRNPNIAGYPF